MPRQATHDSEHPGIRDIPSGSGKLPLDHLRAGGGKVCLRRAATKEEALPQRQQQKAEQRAPA
jgi:hypothetical protein